MAVAKRQRREKPVKIEQRVVRGPEWGPQVKQAALLASPIYIGQARGRKKTYKKRCHNWGEGLLLSSRLLGWPALMPGGCIFFHFLTKNWAVTRSCNTGPSITSIFCCDWGNWQGSVKLVRLSFPIFAVVRQHWGNYTLPWQYLLVFLSSKYFFQWNSSLHIFLII